MSDILAKILPNYESRSCCHIYVRCWNTAVRRMKMRGKWAVGRGDFSRVRRSEADAPLGIYPLCFGK